MIKIIFTVLVFFATMINSSFSEIIRSLEVLGNERITKETIKVYADIKLGSDYQADDINKIVKTLYSTEFFENIEAKFENNKLTLTVKEYPIINQIVIKGEKTEKFKKEIIKLIKSKQRGSYIKNNILKDEIKIKNIYKSLGFNFAEVNSKIKTYTENRVDLIFEINRGEKVKISKINFIGDKKIRERRLRDVIVSEEDKFWKFITRNTVLNEENIRLDKRLLKNYYKSIGYYDVQIISNSVELEDNKNSVVLNYNIDAGKRYRISKISTNIDPSIDKKAFINLSTQYEKIIGDYYSPFKIKRTLEFLDRLIDENDLQFIQHSVKESIDGSNINITINIFENEKIFVERINVNGNTVTNENVIRSEFLLDEGDPFNNLKLKNTISELKARNIFGKVDYKVTDGSEKDTKIIDIIVEEKPTGEISAGAGVGSDGQSLMFSLRENNFLGRGVRLNTFASVNQDSFKGAFEVLNPNFNNSGNLVNFGISSTTNDKPDSGYENSLIALSAGTTFEQFKDVYLSAGFNLTSDKLTVLDNASENLKKQKGTFSDLAVSYGLTFDNRDRSFMPTSGFYSSFKQSLPLIGDAKTIKNTYQLSSYYTLSDEVIGAIKFYAQNINGLSEDVRLSKRLTLPSNRLRGFETNKVGPQDGSDYIGGNYAAALNFEASLPKLLPESTNTDINLFLDLANVWGVDYDSSLGRSNVLRSSVGVSGNWLSPIGPLSLTFAKDLRKAETDKTNSFNFQLGTSF